MKQYKYLIVFIVLIGFSSCQVLNRYKVPELDSRDLYGELTSSDSTTIASIPWQEYFADTHLVKLIEEGLNNNYDLRIAFTRIQQAEASLSMAKAAYFPNIALVGQVNHTSASMGTAGKDVLGYNNTNYVLGVSAGWELDVWGKMNRQSRAKYAQFLSSHAYKNLIRTSLIANIATSYYSLMALDEKLLITKRTLVLLEENVETVEALKEAGILNGAAVEQSKVLLYSTQVTVPELESQIRKLENSISTMLGRKQGSKIERSFLRLQQYPQHLEYGIPAQMLAKRPDVQQTELAFRSAFELTNVAQASFYPTIMLSSGTIGYGTYNTLANFFKPENLFASIIGGLTQPLFARKQLTVNLKIAKAQQQEALLAFEKSVLLASEEVTSILLSFESSLQKEEARKMQVKACLNSVDFTRELLMAGDANYTEVLNAQQNLLSALLNQTNDKLEQLNCSVNLYKVLGGGGE